MGAENYCAQHNWDLLFISFRNDLSAPPSNVQLPEALIKPNRVSGAILSGTHSASVLASLRERRIPFSTTGNNIVGDWRPEEFDCVTTDDVRGAAEATQYLISQGHRNIWFIGNQRVPWFERCGRGYRQVMEEAGLEPHFSELQADDRELGYLAVKSLLTNRSRPTAIFGGNDDIASGVYQALQESGVLIPDDISVAGFNDTLGELLHPGLTTAREFPREVGGHLAEFVLRRIQDPALPPQQLMIPTVLVKRESVRKIESSEAAFRHPDHAIVS
jgi:DNA-binding LacI/PurR family transcriptional regulator